MNNKVKRSLLLSVLGLSVSSMACAGDIFVSPQLGTLGGGINLGYQINDNFKVRANVNYISGDTTKKRGGVEYDVDVDNFTAGLLADIHPFADNFKVSTGFYYMDLSADLKATPDSSRSYKIGDNHYTSADIGTIDGGVSWDKVSPYVGMGWSTDQGSEPGFSFYGDLGVLFLTGAKVSYRATGTANNTNLRDDVDTEARKIRKKIDRFNVYPVVSLGFAYRF